MRKRQRLLFAATVLAAMLAYAVSRSRGQRRRPGAAAVTNYLTYVDGKAGKANPTLSPVQVGCVNQQGGRT